MYSFTKSHRGWRADRAKLSPPSSNALNWHTASWWCVKYYCWHSSLVCPGRIPRALLLYFSQMAHMSATCWCHLLKWLNRVPTSSPMRLSPAGTMPCRHTIRSRLSLVWKTTSWSFPGETLTPVTWERKSRCELKVSSDACGISVCANEPRHYLVLITPVIMGYGSVVNRNITHLLVQWGANHNQMHFDEKQDDMYSIIPQQIFALASSYY